jgi:long-subunit fatty acid transport protein
MEVSLNYQRLYDFRRNLDYRLELSSTTPLNPTSSEHRTYNQDGSIGALGLAYAVEITPSISLGLTLNIWTDRLGWQNGWDATYSNHSTTTFGATNVIQDTYMTEEYSGFEGVNFNLGALWNINEHFTIGGVFKSPFTGDLHYESKQDWASMDEDGNIKEEFHGSYSEENKLKMPMSYGIGAAWRFSDAFTMDLDIYRTDWSNYIMINSQGEEYNPIDARPGSESNVKDTTQVRVGGEYLIINPDKAWVIPIRGGIFYDPEPYPDEIKDFYGFSLGSGFGYKRYVFDAAYQFRWGNEVDTGTLIPTSKADVKQHSFLLSFIFYI